MGLRTKGRDDEGDCGGKFDAVEDGVPETEAGDGDWDENEAGVEAGNREVPEDGNGDGADG